MVPTGRTGDHRHHRAAERRRLLLDEDDERLQRGGGPSSAIPFHARPDRGELTGIATRTAAGPYLTGWIWRRNSGLDAVRGQSIRCHADVIASAQSQVAWIFRR
jgi:hypothetical protein